MNVLSQVIGGQVSTDDNRSGGERDSVQMSQRDMGENCYMTG